MKSTQRDLRGGALAVLISACMLLCAFSPAIVNWNGEEAFASESSDDAFTYVSLGDSMVNAFGSAGYYYEDSDGVYKNCFGFLQEDSFSYTAELAKDKELLSKLSGKDVTDVEFYQMAISGLRSAELRSLLDDDYVRDTLIDEGSLDHRLELAIDAIDPSLGIDTKQEMIDYYKKNLRDADLITYQYHYDIGYAFSLPFFNMMKSESDDDNGIVLDYDCYLDDEYIELMEGVKTLVSDMLMEQLGEEMAAVADYLPLIASLADCAAFGVIAHCSNFDAIMEWIHQENPSASVVVLDAYNNYSGVVFDLMGTPIPFGEIYDAILGIANSYTKYLSPWAPYTQHVDIVEVMPMFYDEYGISLNEEHELSDDAKRVFVHSLVSLMENAMPIEDIADMLHLSSVPNSETNMSPFVNEYMGVYDYLNVDDNLTKLLSCIFGAKYMDFAGALELIPYAPSIVNMFVEAMFTIQAASAGGADVSVVSDKNGCKVVVSAGGVVDEESSVQFTNNELAILFVSFNTQAAENLMSHPCELGHEIIFNSIVENTSSITHVESVIIQSMKDALSGAGLGMLGGFGLNMLLDYAPPGFLYELESFGALMETASAIEAHLMEAPLDNLNRTYLIEAMDDLTEAIEVFFDELNKVMTEKGYKPYDGYVSTATLAASMGWAILHDLADDYLTYSDDVMYMGFDPADQYESVYIGGVFSSFYADGDDISKTLHDLIGEFDEADIASLKGADVIHIASNSGNTPALMMGLMALSDSKDLSEVEPMDYAAYSDILGEDLPVLINKIRDKIAPTIMETLEKAEIGDEFITDIIPIVLDRAIYEYIGSYASVVYLIGMLEEINPDASIIVYGSYNEFRGVDVKIDEDISIPAGDILDKLYAVYDVFIYELCEGLDQVGYADVSDATTSLFGTEINIATGFNPLALFAGLVPDKAVFEAAAGEWLSIDNVYHKITWNTAVGSYVENVRNGDVPKFPLEAVPLPEGGYDYEYKFVGWDNEVVAATDDAVYTAVYELTVIETEGTISVDKSAFDYVDVAQVKTDNWSVQIPTTVFDGLEGEVEISVKVIENKDVSARVAEYAEGKKIISLNLSVGGETVSDFGENTVTVTFAYQPDVGEKMDNISVFWIDDANYRTVEYPAYYDADTGEVTFDTTHFSYWFVGERTVADDEDAGNDYLVSIIAFIVIIVGLCGFLLRLKR